MNYKTLIPLLMFVVSFLSCSKTDSSYNPQVSASSGSSTKYSGQTLLIDQLAIYTSNSVITDPAYIQQYLDRNFNDPSIQNRFHVNQTSVEDPGLSTTLSFLYGSKVELNGRIMEIQGMYNNNKTILVAEYDSTVVPVCYSRCDSLLSKVPAFNAKTDCPDNSCKKYRKKYPVMVSNEGFYLPVIYIGVSTSHKEVINGNDTDVQCATVAQQYPMINLLNVNLLSELTEGDTIIVQTGRLKLAVS